MAFVRGEALGGPVTDLLDENKTEFEDLYYQQGKSLRAVAKHFKVSLNGLNRWMGTRSYTPRTKSEAQRIRWNRPELISDVIRLRVRDHLTMDEIARITGLKGRINVFTILRPRNLHGPVDELPSYEDVLAGNYDNTPKPASRAWKPSDIRTETSQPDETPSPER